jgi:hypothetical protein
MAIRKWPHSLTAAADARAQRGATIIVISCVVLFATLAMAQIAKDPTGSMLTHTFSVAGLGR